jgi:type VI secretion system secreted protein VgrG
MVIQDITQRGRLIKLHTPLGRDALLAERAEIEERISPIEPVGSAGPLTGFKAVVHAVSTNAHIELKALIGQPALLELQTAQGAMRPFHGHITQATNLGSDNGLNAYQIVFEPWLSVLAQRQDSWVFQGQTVMQIIDEVFADYQAQGRLMPAWRWDLQDTAAYPQRSLCAQYQETDLAFVERLLREEGLFYWFEHSGNPDDAATLGQHTLVIADHNGAFAPNAQERIRFTQSSAVLPEDSLNLWDEDVSLEVAGIHLASMDDRTLSARPVSTSSQSQGMALAAELHIADVPGAYAYEDAAQGERLALRQMQAFDALRYQAHAQGTVRSSAPGTTFTLLDHFAHDGTDPIEDQFVMLSVRHTARSNVSSGISASLQQLISGVVSNAPDNTVQANDTDEPVYQCALTVQRADVPVRAAGSGLNLRPTIDGNQTAIVVGLDEPVHTDRDHRIKVQFHWQRGLQSGHRLDHPAGSNAPATEAAWTWVRVAERIAGANWGANFTPRLGQEVLVQFIGSDIDRPVVVGSLYNGRGQADAQGNQVAGGAASSTGDAQPWFPGNGHAAVMSGIKTQELASSASGFGGYNQLTLDDTPDANRIEASTTQSGAQTWLQLGHLLQQQDNQRLKPRGHGIDLGSAAWGAVRAGSGLILSAHGRQPSVAGTQQIDPREPKAQLAQANALVHKMAESAQAHKAMTGAEVKVQGATKQDKAKQLAVEQGFLPVTTRWLRPRAKAPQAATPVRKHRAAWAPSAPGAALIWSWPRRVGSSMPRLPMRSGVLAIRPAWWPVATSTRWHRPTMPHPPRMAWCCSPTARPQMPAGPTPRRASSCMPPAAACIRKARAAPPGSRPTRPSA